MKEIGDWLQRERIRREVSLESIRDETKISVRYLQALEEGRFDMLPDDPYVKGFIRSYARAIGCDPDPILEKYKELKAEESLVTARARPQSRASRGRSFLTKVNETLQWLGL